MNKTYPWTRTYTFAGFHGTRNVDCFNSLLWFCFVWTAVEKTLRLRLISTCTDPVLALNFPLHLSVSRIKTASQLLHLQENTEVLASVYEQNMTGRLTDAEKYNISPFVCFAHFHSFRFTCSLVARTQRACLLRKTQTPISFLFSLRTK